MFLVGNISGSDSLKFFSEEIHVFVLLFSAFSVIIWLLTLLCICYHDYNGYDTHCFDNFDFLVSVSLTFVALYSGNTWCGYAVVV